MKKYTLFLSVEVGRKKRMKVINGNHWVPNAKKSMNDYEKVQICFSGFTLLFAGITLIFTGIDILIKLNLIIP